MPLNRGKFLNQKCKKEGIDKFIPKQSAGYVTNKLLCMTHRSFKVKNKKYFSWKKFQKSKLHADYVTYKK